MSKGGGERMRAFILAQDADSRSIGDEMKARGLDGLDPVMEGGRTTVHANLRHEMNVLLMGHFTHIVMGPDCELMEHAVTMACAGGNLKLEFVNVEKVLPGWTRVTSPAMEIVQ